MPRPKKDLKEKVLEDFFHQDSKANQIAVEKVHKEETWPAMEESYDGQLAVDVYQTKKEIIIKSTIAGVKLEDIDILVSNDMVTIRGRRQKEESIAEEDYFYQECYWGGFSRAIILPTDIKTDQVAATLKNGILTVVLPKASREKSRVVPVKEEE